MTAGELTAGTDGKGKVTRESVLMHMFSWKGTKELRKQVMGEATEMIWYRVCFCLFYTSFREEGHTWGLGL